MLHIISPIFSVFISGKTYLLNVILQYVAHVNQSSIASCFTGSGASLLLNGATCHKSFGLPLILDKNITSELRPGSNKAKSLRAADIIIIDEVSMVHKFYIDLINKLLQSTSDNTNAFGNKLLIGTGDFRQTLPIRPGSSNAAMKKSTIFHSKVFVSNTVTHALIFFFF